MNNYLLNNLDSLIDDCQNIVNSENNNVFIKRAALDIEIGLRKLQIEILREKLDKNEN